MELLDLQLRVPGYPTLDEPTRMELRNLDLFQALPLHRAAQVWGGPIPSEVCFSAQVQDSAVFVTEGWAVAIRGPRLIDCVVSGMCAIANMLGQEFEGPNLELTSRNSVKVPAIRIVPRTGPAESYRSEPGRLVSGFSPLRPEG